ncbi:MAG: hypothetical protein DRP42_06145 [Tenericutes bacterium]|nr:MAG: hypothetical protein DRP42_06145 [Mycoplasmatota bacterium]
MADLKDILQVNDFNQVVLVFGNLPKKPSRIDIEAILIDDGHTLPLANSVSFYLISNNRRHLVVYGKALDEFATTLLNLAT